MVWAGLAIVGLHALFRGWALSRSWFSMDDLFFVPFARNTPSIDVDFLTTVYAGHAMPAGHAVAWVIAHSSAPFTFWPWATFLWLLQVASALGMLRLLVSMFGARWAILVPLTGYVAWIFTMPAGTWWAAGINQLPLQVGLVFGLHAWIAYLRTPRLRHLLVTAGWTLFALAFYEKSVIMFGIYALIAFCWFASGPFDRRIVHLWQRYRAAMVTLVALMGAYLAVYVSYALDFDASSNDTFPGPVAFNLIGKAMATAVVGGPLSFHTAGTSELAHPSDAFLVVAWIALAALVLHAARTRTASKRAWVLVIAPLAVNVQLILSARAVSVGPDIALEYRYQTEMAVLLAVAGALAFLPLLGAVEQNERVPGPALERERPAIVIATTLCVALLAVVSSVEYTQRWDRNNHTAAFYATLKDGIRDAPQHPVPMANIRLPLNVMWPFGYPKNTYQYVFSNLQDIEYPDAVLDTLYVFSDDGELTYAEIEPLRTAPGTAACGVPITRQHTRIALDGPLIDGEWWIRLSYTSPVPMNATITAGETSHRMRLPSGFRNVFLKVSGAFDAVTLDHDGAHRKSCVSELRVGGPVTGLPVTATT